MSNVCKSLVQTLILPLVVALTNSFIYLINQIVKFVNLLMKNKIVNSKMFNRDII